MMQVCNGCGFPQPLSNFAFRKDVNRHRGTCRTCESETRSARRNNEEYRAKERERARRKRAESPEINARAHARWKAAHPEQAKIIQARYRLNGGTEYLRKWRQQNRERYNAYMRAWRTATTQRRSGILELWPVLDAMIPRGLYQDVRDDVRQEVALHCLLRGRPDNLSQLVKSTVSMCLKNRGNRWRSVSLDAPIFADGSRTLADAIAG